MVAETSAKRFWQQVMKKIKRRRNVLKETKCSKRYALLSDSAIRVHFTSSTTSGHCLSWKGGGEDANGTMWGAASPAQALAGNRGLVVRHLQLQGFLRKHQRCQFLRSLPPYFGLFSNYDSWNQVIAQGSHFFSLPSDCRGHLGNAHAASLEMRE